MSSAQALAVLILLFPSFFLLLTKTVYLSVLSNFPGWWRQCWELGASGVGRGENGAFYGSFVLARITGVMQCQTEVSERVAGMGFIGMMEPLWAPQGSLS